MISMMASKKHISVLLKKSIEMLNIKPDGVYVDATAGMGGHSSLILTSLHKGKLICMDQDNYAISVLKEKFGNNKNVTVVKTNFADIVDMLNELGINKVDGIIADLGVSSPMFDNPDRGFSYKFDAKLVEVLPNGIIRLERTDRTISEYEFKEVKFCLDGTSENK